MPRRLSDEPNLLYIRDRISDSEIVLTYRMPSTKERFAYFNESVRKESGRISNRTQTVRTRYGADILVGIREGDFEIRNGEKYISISSDPASPSYHANWKEHLTRHAPDLLSLLAMHVFEGFAETLPAPAENKPTPGGEEQ
jgi:hypothetical protein